MFAQATSVSSVFMAWHGCLSPTCASLLGHPCFASCMYICSELVPWGVNHKSSHLLMLDCHLHVIMHLLMHSHAYPALRVD